ncbi:uncharacterized protein yc1106_07669 [Curvularia clavata]|uniref:Uncharacterized protein n=1 Tax=Curvularia clavata TaxID=95742 RepID=A0A9Q9DVX9_CURCL|nr:uncharacterized protein yc1106_07669 [Curvularia clavata]
MPRQPAMDKADLAAYMTVRILGSFPNLIHAINKWQTANPDKQPIIGHQCEWGEALGGSNPVIAQALQSDDNLWASFLWDIAKNACRGSAKIDFTLRQARSMVGQQTTISRPNPASY